MKKIFFIATILCVLASSANVSASDLDLNPNVLNNKNETYSSITDIYKTPIFSDKYKATIEEKERKEAKEKLDLSTSLFSGKDNLKNNNEKRSGEIKELFNKDRVINSNLEDTKRHNYKLLILISIVFASVLIVICTNKYYKNKNVKEDSCVYNNNFKNI